MPNQLVTPQGTLDLLKRIAVAEGYRFEVDADGTERMIRPDGSVAVIARRAQLQSPDQFPQTSL